MFFYTTHLVSSHETPLSIGLIDYDIIEASEVRVGGGCSSAPQRVERLAVQVTLTRRQIRPHDGKILKNSLLSSIFRTQNSYKIEICLMKSQMVLDKFELKVNELLVTPADFLILKSIKINKKF